MTADPEEIRRADRVILPGVGAFGDAIDKLRATGLDWTVLAEAERGKQLLGICLGMQLLFDKGYEFGEHDGLGLLRGSVVPMQGTIPPELKIPQMGWNALIQKRSHPLLRDVKEGDCVYFVRQPGGHDGIRQGTDRCRCQGERDGLPVPPGEERARGAFDPASLCGDGVRREA